MRTTDPSNPACVALSGGRDSVATALHASERWRVEAAVTVVHEFLDGTCLENARRCAERLGLRHELVRVRLRGWFRRALRRGLPICTKCARTVLTAACLRAKRLGLLTVLTGHELKGKYGRRVAHPYPPGVTMVRYPALRRWTWEDVGEIVSGLGWFDEGYTCPIRPYGVHRFIERVGYNPLTGRACSLMVERVASPRACLEYLIETETPEWDAGEVEERLGLELHRVFEGGVPEGPRDEEEIVRDLTYRLLMFLERALRSYLSGTLNRIVRTERFAQLHAVLYEYSEIDDRVDDLGYEHLPRLAVERDEGTARRLLEGTRALMRELLREYGRRIPGTRV